MDIYPFKICGSGYDIISEKSGYDPFLEKDDMAWQLKWTLPSADRYMGYSTDF